MIEGDKNKFPYLFNSYYLGKIKLKNRIVFPPITTNFAFEGIVTNEMIDYYSCIAQGGVGSIIVEAAMINPKYIFTPFSLGVWDDRFIFGLNKLVNILKLRGAAAFLQVAHAGPKTNCVGVKPVSASEVPLNKLELPRKLTVDEIHETVKDFIRAAKRARNAGFDGIELHAAHFYLLSAFLSPFTNTREDEYGGDTLGRTRMLREIITGVKKEVGANFPIICRINGLELVEKGINLSEAKKICEQLENAGADALHISSFHLPVPGLENLTTVPATSVPGKSDLPGVYVNLAKEIKSTSRLPVIAVGKINSGQLAEDILVNDKCDLVAIGRPMVADHDFLKKILSNKEPNSCLYCRNCINTVLKNKKMRCRVNKKLIESNII